MSTIVASPLQHMTITAEPGQDWAQLRTPCCRRRFDDLRVGDDARGTIYLRTRCKSCKQEWVVTLQVVAV